MKSKVLFISLVVLAAFALGACAKSERHVAAGDQTSDAPSKAVARNQDDHSGHNHGKPGEVPAFETDVIALKTLAPTLSPALFVGKQREGYEAAKAIPRTLAQLPCYCHCDRGFGHRSLHTCFVDDHAAHCAVCIDEALLAYRLEKDEKLTPEQIRARIIAQYSAQ